MTKLAPSFVYETLECLGGNGYVEDLPMARLYREAPLNAIWEPSWRSTFCVSYAAIASGRKP